MKRFRSPSKLKVTPNLLSLAEELSTPVSYTHLDVYKRQALTNFKLVKINYHSPETNETTERTIEPFAMYSTQNNLLLIAFCLLRKDFRTFRLDRILNFIAPNEHFEPHKITLQQYFEICREKYFSSPLT